MECGGHVSGCFARVGGDHLRNTGQVEHAIDEQRHCAEPYRFGRKVVTVVALAAHAAEQRPGAHRAAVVGDVCDVHLGVTVRAHGARDVGVDSR